MTTKHPAAPPRPILTRAAENGVLLGAIIGAMVLAMGLSTVFPAAALLLWGGTLAMPFITYRMLRRSAVASGGTSGFPEIWAEGIASYFLGSLIPALIAYVSLRFFAPTFIADTVNSSIAILESQGADYAMMADTLRQAAAAKMPTATDVAAQLISFNIIAGTTLSLIVAIPVSLTTRRRTA